MQRAKTLHEQIANTIRDRIAMGIYPENEMLPPEMLLCSEFGCSRHTIREAMKTLVGERLMVRKAGLGTIVAPRPASGGPWGIQSISDLIGEFLGKGSKSQIVVLKHGLAPARTVPSVAELFGLRPTASVYAIQRLISQKSGPIAFHRLWTHLRFARRIPKDIIGTQPLIEQIEEHCRVRAVRTRQVASAVEAEGEIAKILGVRKGTALLQLRRTYLDRSDAPIEHTELLCRPDRYEQTVDFYRDAPAKAQTSR